MIGKTALSGISWQCCHCNKKFANLGMLKHHMENDCAKNKPKKQSPKELAQTLLSKLPNIRAKIVKANNSPRKSSIFSNPRKCIWHCSNCPQVFSTEEGLGTHLQSCKKIVDGSKKNNSSKPNPLEPYRFDRFRNVYICNKCLCEYNVKSEIDAHISGGHPVFSCKHCDTDFDYLVELGYHSKEHSSTEEMSCPCCDFKSKLKSKLSFHIQTAHSLSSDAIDAQETNFTCVVCSKSFHSERKLIHHQKNYHKAMIDSLPSMGARLKESSPKAVFTERTIYLCDNCGKDFNTKYRLERHQRAMHQGLKPFVCRYCGRSFTGKDTMQKHERIHTGEKPYSCEYCGKCFRQPGPFTVHLRIHTGERPYVCKFCHKGFITNQSRKSHVNNCPGKESEFSYFNMLNY